MILLWGLAGDGPLAAVRTALERMGAPVFFFDQRDSLSAEIDLSVDDRVHGALRVGDREVDLGAVTAAYLRPYDTRRIPAVARAPAGGREAARALAVEDALLSWAELTGALVVSPPSAMAPNGSKPYQAALIAAHGLRTPETLITTDPAEVRAFAARHGAVIYKSLSGVRSVVSRLSPVDERRIEDVRWCPTQFQAYVPGEDYRVHVVGERSFTAKVVSTAVDYRYPSRQGGSTRVERGDLPAEIAARCRAMARAMRLPVAGIDLRRTPSGEWICFEVNPSPGFTYYQEECGDPIDEAIATLLQEGAG